MIIYLTIINVIVMLTPMFETTLAVSRLALAS